MEAWGSGEDTAKPDGGLGQVEALQSLVEAWGSGEDAAKPDGGSGQRWRRCRVWRRLRAAVKTLRSLMADRGSGGDAAESGGGSDGRASFGVPWHVRNLRHRVGSD